MSSMNQPQAQGFGSPMSNPAQAQGIGSPVSNEVYDVITTLQSKLEGLEAYRKFAQSGGNVQLWQYLNQIDTQAVQVLMQQLEQMAQTGQLRQRQPGQVGQQAQPGQPIS